MGWKLEIFSGFGWLCLRPCITIVCWVCWNAGQVLSELISSVEKTGAKYSVLYVSDPVNVIRYPSYRQVDRFLAEKSGNSSDDGKCDGVCQIKSSMLEGLFVVSWLSLLILLTYWLIWTLYIFVKTISYGFVMFQGLVLLVILISGLCCMAGIDTPTRFEAPQES